MVILKRINKVESDTKIALKMVRRETDESKIKVNLSRPSLFFLAFTLCLMKVAKTVNAVGPKNLSEESFTLGLQ